MSVNFYDGNDKKPAKLFVSDRVTIHDQIVFSEAYYSFDDNCVSFYGILSDSSIGIENSKDKAWRLNGGQTKALLQFYRDKKPTWDNEARKFADKQVEPSENYLYTYAVSILKTIDGDCISVVVKPYVNPQFFEDVKQNPTDTVITYWENTNKDKCVAVTVEPKVLTDADREVLKNNSSSSAGGNKTYQKPESESEKLEARWLFVKQHLGEGFKEVNSLYELGALLAIQQSTPEGVENRETLLKTLELIQGMWK